MKEYFFQKNSNFINKGFSELKRFNFVNSFDLYNYLLNQEFNLKDSKSEDYFTFYERVDAEQNWLKGYGQSRQVCRLRVKTDCTASLTSKFTYKAVQNNQSHIESDIFREDTIRSMYSPSLFLYLCIPHKFLLDNLSTNLDYTDLQLFYREFKKVNLNSFKNIIENVEKLDRKYPLKTIIPGQTEPKTEDFFKWRSGIMFNMLYSVFKVGFAYPLINTPVSSIMFDGTHRLSIAPLVEKDYPVLLRIQPGEVKKNFYYITPNIFKDNKCSLLVIDTEAKTVKIKLLSLEETVAFTKINKCDKTIKNIEIKDYIEFEKFLTEINNSEFDFIWHEQ